MNIKFEIPEGAYPPHIYDTLRAEVATAYIQHEMRKYFPSVHDEHVWSSINSDIEDWFQKTMSIRDFWNGVHGMAMGFKLQNGMMQNITAENVAWRKEDFPVSELHFGTDQSHWTGVETLSAREILDHYSKGGINEENKEMFRAHENDPVIVLRKKRGEEIHNSIYDGNRRVSLAILDAREKVPAYIGEYMSEEWKPKNFWLPTSFLMDIVENGELASDYDATLNILKKFITLSRSGEYELRERVLVGKNEFRMRLAKDIFGA